MTGMSFLAPVEDGEVLDIPLAGGPAQGRTDLDFSEAFHAAYEDQTRGWAVFGLERAFRDAEAEQISQIREATGEHFPPLGTSETLVPGLTNTAFDSFGDYFEAAKHFEGEVSLAMADRIKEREARLDKLRDRLPGLKSYREMWQGVRQSAQDAEAKWARTNNRASGVVGGFIGGIAGVLDPRSDPFNFFTLGVGGVGKTAVRRIATEFGAQTAIEGINQATGVQENRELLGLENSTRQAIEQSVFAGVGGAVFRSAGEAGFAGFKALTARQSEKPQQIQGQDSFSRGSSNASKSVLDTAQAHAEVGASTRAPYGTSRAAVSREEIDFEAIKAELDAGRSPLDVLYKSDRQGVTASDPEIARRMADPDLYRQIDDLERRMEAERAKLDAARSDKQKGITFDRELLGEAEQLQRQIDETRAELEATTDPKARRRLGRRIQSIQGRLSRGEIVDLDTALDRAGQIEAEAATLRTQAAEANDRRKAKRLTTRADKLEAEIPPLLARFDLDQAADIDSRIVTASRNLQELTQKRDELRPLEKRADAVATDARRPAISRPSMEAVLRHSGFTQEPPPPKVRDTVETGNLDTEPDGPLVRAADEMAKAADGGEPTLQGVDLGDGIVRPLDEEIPLGVKFDDDGNFEGFETKTVRQIVQEIGEDKRLADAMRFCGLKG